ncbi:hypothetical protein [Vibrio mediterranei]|uniref:hypothetical protein n=1 Tax=Vibrio mediterranei TaxID=689 RepID=UPI004067E525
MFMENLGYTTLESQKKFVKSLVENSELQYEEFSQSESFYGIRHVAITHDGEPLLLFGPSNCETSNELAHWLANYEYFHLILGAKLRGEIKVEAVKLPKDTSTVRPMLSVRADSENAAKNLVAIIGCPIKEQPEIVPLILRACAGLPPVQQAIMEILNTYKSN